MNEVNYKKFYLNALDQLTSQIITQIEENSSKEEVIEALCALPGVGS